MADVGGKMGDYLNVSASELYASAGAADTLVTDLHVPLRTAIDDIAAAASAFRAWDDQGRIAAVATGWGDALTDLKDHLAEHAKGAAPAGRRPQHHRYGRQRLLRGW